MAVAEVVMMIGVDMAEVDTVVVAEEVMMTVVDMVEVVVVMVVIMMVMVEAMGMTIVEVMVVATIEAIDLFNVFGKQLTKNNIWRNTKPSNETLYKRNARLKLQAISTCDQSPTSYSLSAYGVLLE